MTVIESQAHLSFSVFGLVSGAAQGNAAILASVIIVAMVIGLSYARRK